MSRKGVALTRSCYTDNVSPVQASSSLLVVANKMDDSDCLQLDSDLSLKDLMMNISVTNEDIWGKETSVWLAFFYLYIATFVIAFCILVALAFYVVTQRKKAERSRLKKVNTFYAINSMIIIMGVLRVAHLIFDPYYVEGWLHERVPHIILSIIFSMGFPSLTASYLLVFITLWMSRRIKGAFTCIQKLSVLIPLCAFQFVVTLLVELIALSNQYEIIYLIIACDLFFCLWGIVICVLFLLAGRLLIKSIGVGNRSSVCVDEENKVGTDVRQRRYTGSRRFTFTKRRSSTLSYKRKGIEHRQRAMMKVTIVTLASAILGILYSLVSIVNVALAIALLFQETCVNQASGNRAVWLFMQYFARIIELLLGFLLLYSVADTTKLMKYLFKKWKKCKQSDDKDGDTEITMSDLDSDASRLRNGPISNGSMSNCSLNNTEPPQSPPPNSQHLNITQLPSVTEETLDEKFEALLDNDNRCLENNKIPGKLLTRVSDSLLINKHDGIKNGKLFHTSISDSNITVDTCETAYQLQNDQT